MRAPFLRLYVHLVWSTWNRLPLISPDLKEPIKACAIDKCQELGAEVVAIETMPDHMHLLARIPATLPISALAKEVKGSSSHLVTHLVQQGSSFKWQGAYGAFSVSPRDVERIKSYVCGQEKHHTENSLLANWEICQDPTAR